MKALITSDMHLNDAVRDEYRFGIFKWLTAQATEHKAAVFILGDLTDAKDRHSAKLVNRIVDELSFLPRRAGVPLYLLMGNHDYIDEATPFFRFVSLLPLVKLVREPHLATLDKGKILMLPHSREPGSYKRTLAQYRDGGVDVLLLHQTVRGARSETGTELDGVPASLFDIGAKAYSGDIHVPQRIGCVEYVGAPYHVHFGDSFEPRVVLLDGRKARDLHFPAPRKPCHMIRDAIELSDLKLRKGDMVKVRVKLPRSEVMDWRKHKQAIVDQCDKLGVVLSGIELLTAPARQRLKDDKRKAGDDVLETYIERKRLDHDLADIGRGIAEEIQ